LKQEIRQIEACQAWALRQKVMWPDKGIDYVKLEQDSSGIHYGLFQGLQLISVISVFLADEAVQFRKFATHCKKQRQGLGTQLLQHVLDEAAVMGARRIWCNARLDAAGFYRKLGFREVGEPFERDGLQYVRMSRELGET